RDNGEAVLTGQQLRQCRLTSSFSLIGASTLRHHNVPVSPVGTDGDHSRRVSHPCSEWCRDSGPSKDRHRADERETTRAPETPARGLNESSVPDDRCIARRGKGHRRCTGIIGTPALSASSKSPLKGSPAFRRTRCASPSASLASAYEPKRRDTMR